MNITLFGGSFNPPHLGHALIIQEFLASGLTDEIWLLPNFQHTFGKDLAPAHHRQQMCNILIEYLNGLLAISHNPLTIKLCTIEIDLQLSGQTYETLQALQNNSQYLINNQLITENSKPKTYSFLMGSDQLPHFHKWGHYQELLTEMRFWIYPRAGYDMNPLQPGMKPFLTDHQTITNLSSTLVRKRLATNENTSLILPAKMQTYIVKHNLYVSHKP